ncbi:DUF6262 family protein [Nocardia sp. 348MFTsu5.1]|uniref:DUF6262 family protein n=1 Tax=Nocardia sp. 348MFTsu5.1 TaxID=1172185 RepID=UPI000363605D|nr:DUF6262 family protein [Nocardia sp. 348MFTsu5.1]
MNADNTKHLHIATRRRSDDARHRAVTALEELQATDRSITITFLAQRDRVARSWIYTQPDLLEAIRQTHTRTTTPPAHVTGASDSSWQRRIELAHTCIKELSEENKKLRHQLAIAHGQRRASTVASKTPSTTQTPSSDTTTTR